jgi:hypothetical protein
MSLVAGSVADLGIDERTPAVDLLPAAQGLFGEAEAFHLAKYWPALAGVTLKLAGAVVSRGDQALCSIAGNDARSGHHLTRVVSAGLNAHGSAL